MQRYPDNRLVHLFIFITFLLMILLSGYESLLLFAACSATRCFMVPRRTLRCLRACIFLLVIAKESHYL